MGLFRIALANLEYPDTPERSIALAEAGIRAAASAGAEVVCFPECYIPGYPRTSAVGARVDAAFLQRGWSAVATAAGAARIAVVLGTERLSDEGRLLTALVIGSDGNVAGFQDKVQLDPSEEGLYV